jgi:hypothetical protein
MSAISPAHSFKPCSSQAVIFGVAAATSAAHGYTLTNYFDENELINRVNNDATNTWYVISFLVATFIRTFFIRTSSK